MPVERGMGFSLATPEKHKHTNALFKFHLGLIRRVKQRERGFDSPVVYIDLTAGPGLFRGVNTAPVQFFKHAKALDINAKGLLYEKNEDAFLELREQTRMFSQVTILNCDFEDHVEWQLSRWISQRAPCLGILYYDPTKYADIDRHMATIRRLLQRPALKRVDFLMHVNANAVKKMCGCDLTCRLHEHLRKLPKKQWIIRRLVAGDAWQFTFAFGSNWVDYPSWDRLGFVRLDSDEGKQIWNTVCLTKKEQSAGLSIAPIVNT